MRVIEEAAGFAAFLEQERCTGRTVGLVPTMGALHAGHVSLIERAAAQCATVAVTIFVNPLQFAPTDDLAAYPRDEGGDLRQAAAAGTAVVFTPTVVGMYPQPVLTTVHVAGLGDVLEGAQRPGHLDGVATVVTKLFALAGRCRAYFGEKDFQQLTMVRRMALDLSLPVEVVGCPIVRDHDGVALSSRNAYLTREEREAAPVLNRAIRSGVAAILAGERDPAAVSGLVADIISAEPTACLESVDVVDETTLTVPAVLAGAVRILVVCRFGRARLLYNRGVTVPEAPEEPGEGP